jgi:DNA (cytosine-5)-methyltransferase 1
VTRRLTYGSVFSGIGGIDLGFDRAGLVCAWQVELSEFCRRVLAKHWPRVRRHADVRTFPPTDPSEWGCDVVCGGFPCKQTSTVAAVHGYRDGLAGPDSGLWFEMLRVVRLVRPRWVVVENVAGAGRWAAEIEGGLAGAGYRVPGGPARVSAEAFGAPHRRRRLLWVAHRDEPGLEVAGLPDPPAAEFDPGGALDGNPWVSALPGVLRVDDGVPAGLDRRARIEAVGNAVVPQAAEWVGRWIAARSVTRKGR